LRAYATLARTTLPWPAALCFIPRHASGVRGVVTSDGRRDAHGWAAAAPMLAVDGSGLAGGMVLAMSWGQHKAAAQEIEARPAIHMAFDLDFCPSARPRIETGPSYAAWQHPPSMLRGQGRTGLCPVMTAGVLSTPANQPVGENTTAPIRPGVRMPSARNTSPSMCLSKRRSAESVKVAGAADSAAPPSCRVRTSRGYTGGRCVGHHLW